MKAFIRTYILAFASVYFANLLVGGLNSGQLIGSSHILFVLALALAQFFLFPLLKLLTLPTKGLSGIFLRTILVGLIFYMSTSALDGFSITSTYLPEVRIMDVTLPSKSLSPIETLVALALTYSIINTLLNWLFKGKK